MRPGALIKLLLTATLACTGGGKTSDGATEGSSGTTAPALTDGSSDGTSTGDESGGLTSTTAPTCPIEGLTQCEDMTLCPRIDVSERPGPGLYAESELCGFVALRDRTPGLLYYDDCHGTGCNGVWLLITADGRAFGQFFGFDAEQGSSFQGKPSPCELAEPAVLDACIEAFDPSCRWAELITSCNNAEPLCEQCP